MPVSRSRPIIAIDAETDPANGERFLKPFVWGLYDGKQFVHYRTTDELIAAIQDRNIIAYAHNGGKFDFMYLIKYVKQTKAQIINGRIVSMYLGKCELRDSFAAVPESLEKAVGKKQIDYWKFEAHCRNKYMMEIIDYLEWDCRYLYELMKRYRSIAGSHKTIASNALSFSRKLGIDMGRTNHRFDTKYRRFFFGGRTECLQFGTHFNLRILDIHSAYPFAMLHPHATGAEFERGKYSIEEMSREQIERSFIILECFSNGAFPLRTHTGLSFPREYNQFYVTGWEYLAAVDLGLLRNVKILSIRTAVDTIDFSPYVLHWYQYKKDHPRKLFPIEYVIAKIMLNSLYGKSAQNPTRYYDYMIFPAGTPTNSKEGWQMMVADEDWEIHRRSVMWKYQFEYGVEWESKNIYYNVATGASITGFTRAYLLRAMHAVGMEHVIYCDTDSIICNEHADISRLPQTDKLGDWELEEACAPIGHFAGKKLYGIRLSDGKEKMATKGATGTGYEWDGEPGHKPNGYGSRMTMRHIEKMIAGETVTWHPAFPTMSLARGTVFVPRLIKATARRP